MGLNSIYLGCVLSVSKEKRRMQSSLYLKIKELTIIGTSMMEQIVQNNNLLYIHSQNQEDTMYVMTILIMILVLINGAVTLFVNGYTFLVAILMHYLILM